MKLLFDIGGTQTRMALTSDGKTLSDFFSFDTPVGFDDGMKAITDYAKKNNNVIDGVFGGFPGNFDKTSGNILYAPNLPDWVGKPLKKHLSVALQTEVLLQNDAALAGLGEAVFGAGRGYEIVAFITISTGVGGARVVNQKIDPVAIGSEPGYQIVASNNGIFHYLENLIGGKSILNRFKVKPEDLENDYFWNQFAEHLAIGLTNLTVFWSPQVIVIGGGVGLSDKLPLVNIETLLHKYIKIFPAIPRLVKAELQDKAGLMGALALIENKEKLT